jgi:hypothetical protein
MPLAPTLNKPLVTNFPTPLDTDRIIKKRFLPNDLLLNGEEGGNNFYMQIGFQEYSFGERNQIGLTGSDLLYLPIPQKVNDSLLVGWSEHSTVSFNGFNTNTGAGKSPVKNAVKNAGTAIVANPTVQNITGFQINPYLILYFQRPFFRQFSFSWTFALRTEQESKTLRYMVNTLKDNASPVIGAATMGYPNVALINLFPNDMFNMLRFKPCAIMGVTVDHTPVGPAFVENGSPVLASLRLDLKEVGVWSQGEFTESQQQGGIDDVGIEDGGFGE